jgi:hypothetical protein
MKRRMQARHLAVEQLVKSLRMEGSAEQTALMHVAVPNKPLPLTEMVRLLKANLPSDAKYAALHAGRQANDQPSTASEAGDLGKYTGIMREYFGMSVVNGVWTLPAHEGDTAPGLWDRMRAALLPVPGNGGLAQQQQPAAAAAAETAASAAAAAAAAAAEESVAAATAAIAAAYKDRNPPSVSHLARPGVHVHCYGR